MGSLPSVSGMSARQLQPLVPLRSTGGASPSLAGQSRMVAFAETGAGAALIAFAIFCSRVIFDAPIVVPRAGIGIVCGSAGLAGVWPPAMSETDTSPARVRPATAGNALRDNVHRVLSFQPGITKPRGRLVTCVRDVTGRCFAS